MTELMPSSLPAGLTQAEGELIYNLEILQLPVRKAASLAGCSPVLASRPHILQARALVKRELRGNLPTREDIAHEMIDAIGRARVLSEPMTELIGWEKVAKLLGMEAPTKVDINITESINVVQNEVRSLPDAELMRLAGAGDVIDAEFYDRGPA